MRVIAGRCRSLPLKTVEGPDTRPTTDRIKETLFNILMPYIPGCRFLDLFAGSGGIGIEALSRGASFCCFVDNSKKAVRVIRDNLKFTKLEADAVVLQTDAAAAAGSLKGPFDVIYLDPPYGMGLEKEVLSRLRMSGCIADDAIFIVEESLDADFSWAERAGYEIYRVKRYKTNQHVFLRFAR
ncbi:MAG: 16S rRNA (guanine(966)-N(2))-methyltransferase RsmD [Bilifractor sp.]|jgi:16S rRNA (guanine966-N2)-methyltransferase